MDYYDKYLKNYNQIGGWTVQEYRKGTDYIEIQDMPKKTTIEHLKLFLIDRKFRFDNITQDNNNFTLHFSSPDIASKSRHYLIKVLAGKKLGLPAYNPNYVKPESIELEPHKLMDSDESVATEHVELSNVLKKPLLYPPTKSNKITTIENGLREFGLKKFNLIDNNSIDNYFDIIVNDLDNLSNYIDEFVPFKDGYTLKHKGLYGSYYEKNYIIGTASGSGSWNNTFTCTDEKGKQFIIKETNTPNIDGEKSSFYENMKHLILYILIRKYIGKLKFIPQIYHLGIIRKSKDKISVICIMEKGEHILGDYINLVRFENTQKLFLKIYNSLFIIEDKLKINFKHNDFKENNILVSSDGKPLLIDFGFSEFKIDNIQFYTLYNFHEKFDATSYFGYNIIHDMMQLITSLYNSPNSSIVPYNIFKFVKNRNTNILDTDILIRYLIVKFPASYTDKEGKFNKTTNLLERVKDLKPDELAYLKKMFLTFYNKGKYDLVDDKLKIPLLIDKSIFITPTELANNMGIPLPSDNDSFGNFEEKYLKYKNKYLRLKKSLSI
jgi:hypothetical protein